MKIFFIFYKKTNLWYLIYKYYTISNKFLSIFDNKNEADAFNENQLKKNKIIRYITFFYLKNIYFTCVFQEFSQPYYHSKK